MSSLADRIRGIVAPGEGGTFRPAAGLTPGATWTPADISARLGGEWRANALVVDRRWQPSALHGRERIGALAERLDRASAEAPLFTGGAPARPPFVFFDLETTGLSGGAGTLAFLVGCAWFDAEGSFVTRQFLLARHADERALLEAVAAELGRAGALVSFNGKSFDAPLLEGRYLFHRLAWRGRELPHVDVLHAARRFWKPRDSSPEGLRYGSGGDLLVAQPFRAPAAANARTSADRIATRWRVPGFRSRAISSSSAAATRTARGDPRTPPRPADPGCPYRAAAPPRARTGPEGDHRSAERSLGHVYARGGLETRARESYHRAIDRCRSPRGAYDPIRIDALRALALTCRRARRHEEAARCWIELSEMRGCPAPIVREATEALAIHHEHRVRDLALARRFALGSLAALDGAPRPSLAQAVRHPWRDHGNWASRRGTASCSTRNRLVAQRAAGRSIGRPAPLPSWPWWPWPPSRRSCGSPRSARRTSC